MDIKSIIADGVVDSAEVAQIRAYIYADGKIDREEADQLFEINDAVSGANNDAGWPNLFAEAITSHVLDDDESNGDLDEDEWAYVKGKVEGDGQIDVAERALLAMIKAKANSVPDDFVAFCAQNDI